jgi:hypothetical protein
MEGLRLSQKCFTGRTEYGIRIIVDVLEPELSRLYCVTHEEFLMYLSGEGKALTDEQFEEVHKEYEHFLLEELERVGNSIRHLKLFDCGFLPRFRDYLSGDWTSFYLLSTRIPLAFIQPWSNQVPPECEIFISCVDAAYWEVYARDTSLLTRIKEYFPDTEGCKLQDKTV